MMYNIENEEIRVCINSAGAELSSLWDKKMETEHIWQGDPSVWPRQAPIIFPVCGKLIDTTYTLDGKAYQMPLHGFARDHTHQLVAQTQTMCRLRLTQSEETYALYPFQFQFDSIFTMEGSSLHHGFEVTNTGDRTMPFSIGYHTGYRCPFDAAHTIDEYRLHFEKKETANRLVTEDLKIIGEEPYLVDTDIIALHDNLFNPNLTFTGLRSGSVRLEEQGSGRAVKVDFHGFPTLVLWSTRNKVPFVCIEPWYGLFEPQTPYGDLFHKPYIQTLAPGARFACETVATIERGGRA